MKESTIERKLVQGVKALGGRVYKFVSPGNAGVPDRMVVLPGGRITFVELKTETGRLSKVQRFQIGQLEKLGCDVRVLRGADAVQRFLNQEIRHQAWLRGEPPPNDGSVWTFSGSLHRVETEGGDENEI